MPPEELHTLLSSAETDELDDEKESKEVVNTVTRKLSLRSLVAYTGIISICLGIVIIFNKQPFAKADHSRGPQLSGCRSPRSRVEWRSLRDSQKHAYIDAVQCLRSTPSVLSLPQSLYDDFPYVHMHVGNSTHDTAGFLPWHRYFVHLYETALRDRCNYTGAMVYWDWTLDWADFSQSPVWDAETGFGGDGGVDSPRSVGQGRCVADGPFAGLQALYSNLRYRPHCLSRGFPSERELARWTRAFRPEAVKKVMAIREYRDFYLELENGPHLAIPYSIRGDFYRFTAPYGMFTTVYSSTISVVMYLI